MFEEFKAPDRTQPMISSKKIFLAGSIDMGSAEDWQSKLTKELKIIGEKGNKNITVFNPRRDDWNSSWSQEINNTQFFDQVMWELDHIDDSDLVIVYFAEDSKSPITLLELGKVSEMKDKKILVFCPKKFYRKGNVDIVCYRKKIPVFEKFEDFLKEIKNFFDYEESDSNEKQVEESIENSSLETQREQEIINENEIMLRDLRDNPIIEFSKAESNILVVEDFEYIEDSCMMGKIRFQGRTIYSGICNENGKTKVTMNVLRNDGKETPTIFELQKASKDESEKIYLSE